MDNKLRVYLSILFLIVMECTRLLMLDLGKSKESDHKKASIPVGFSQSM